MAPKEVFRATKTGFSTQPYEGQGYGQGRTQRGVEIRAPGCARHHPSYDGRLNLYPVMLIDRIPSGVCRGHGAE